MTGTYYIWVVSGGTDKCYNKFTMKEKTLFAAVAAVCALTASADFRAWAPTPPMGWNSWDCYGSHVTEAEVKANADWQSEHLLRHGYEYCVVDIRWTVQNEDFKGYNQKDPVYTLDAWGRYLPAPNRFPSAADGRGFKPLADYVHAKGLKFGIHIMRGVPKEAVAKKMPVLGADGVTCDMIGNNRTECAWLKDNCTVEKGRPGAQEYYDSIFRLYAEWGVDFVKVDDLSAPVYRKDEVEMIRRAIDKCGRPMVSSTSPGETPFDAAEHLRSSANMWRMVNDVWDSWGHITHLVPIACEWLEKPSVEGCWPDCDMIPLGKLGVAGHWWSKEGGKGRACNLTPDEQRTLMNFFAICRSPLILGADLPQLQDDPATLALLTDPLVLAAQRDGRSPKPVFRDGEKCAIVSDNAKGGRFLALFNLKGEAAEVAALGVSRVLPPHGSALVALPPAKGAAGRPSGWPVEDFVLANVLDAQKDCGGWGKNLDKSRPLDERKRAKIVAEKGDEMSATIDNGATTSEIRYLLKYHAKRGDAPSLAAAKRGIEWLLAAQLPNGGWAQFPARKKGYWTHVTFNDNAMCNVLALMRDAAKGGGDFASLDAGLRERCAAALKRGVACVLACQIRVDGKPTVWCQQHDRETLAPAGGRAYELASFCSHESAEIALFLMSLDDRTPEVRAALDGAAAWFEKTRLEDGRWARFYDLAECRPFFCDRSGVPKRSLDEISKERRTGYMWFTRKPEQFLKKYSDK